MPKYRKKPVVVEACRYMIDIYMPDWFMDKAKDNTIIIYADGTCDIKTLEGTMKAGYGDYIIKGVQGELYPCKPDIFLKTYEEVDNAETQEERKTYLSEYLKEHNCSYKEFMEHQEMYNGFCPVGLEENPCPAMDCIECWNQEVKGE